MSESKKTHRLKVYKTIEVDIDEEIVLDEEEIRQIVLDYFDSGKVNDQEVTQTIFNHIGKFDPAVLNEPTRIRISGWLSEQSKRFAPSHEPQAPVPFFSCGVIGKKFDGAYGSFQKFEERLRWQRSEEERKAMVKKRLEEEARTK